MGNLIRWILGIPLALFLTFVLFVTMMAMISKEWQAQDKVATAKFEVNPTVEDIQVVERQTVIDQVKRVQTPPPPPQIERQQASQPSEPIATLQGAVPKFEPPRIKRESFKITVSDRDAQPLFRAPPIMPPRFLEGSHSGHCRVRFDVSPEGSPFNIVNTYCTSRILERATIKSVEKWKFAPKVVDGRPVSMAGVENRVAYVLTNEKGKPFPEPNR